MHAPSSHPSPSSSPMRPAVVLACHGAPGADLNMVRSLGEAGVPVIVVGEYEYPPSGYSRHCQEFICARDFTVHPERLLRVLRELRMRHGQALPVFPTADSDLRTLVSLHAALVGTALWVSPSPEMIDRLMDKRRFAELAAEMDLPVPATHAPATLEEVEALSRAVDYPVVLKPVHASAWKRPGTPPEVAGRRALFVETPDELMRLCCLIAPQGLDVLVQQHVAGPDDHHHSVHACLSRAGRLQGVVTTRKWRTWPVRAGSGCHVETVSEPELEAEAAAIVMRLRLRGMVVMNYKRDAATGRFMLLEINPRFSGTGILVTRAGFNMPARVHADACRREEMPAPSWRTGLRYLNAKPDLRAAMQMCRTGRLTWRAYLRSVLRPGLVYQALDLGDMGPPVQMTTDWVTSKVLGSGRWVRRRLGPSLV